MQCTLSRNQRGLRISDNRVNGVVLGFGVAQQGRSPFPYSGFILGMNGDQSFTVTENSVEIFFLVHEQTACAGAHKNLDAAGWVNVIQGFEIVYGRSDEKSKVSNAGGPPPGDFPVHLLLIDGGGVAVRHFKETCHASPNRGS